MSVAEYQSVAFDIYLYRLGAVDFLCEDVLGQLVEHKSVDGTLDGAGAELGVVSLVSQEAQSLRGDAEFYPLTLNGSLVGFIGVDNPRENTDTLLLMQSASAFVANDICKRETVEERIILLWKAG